MDRDENIKARDHEAATARQRSRSERQDDERAAPRRSATRVVQDPQQVTIAELLLRIAAAEERAAAARERTAAANERTAAANERTDAANERTDAANERTAAANERAAAANERAAAAKERLAAVKLAEFHKLADGTYYTALDDLWPVGMRILAHNCFDRFRRIKVPNFREGTFLHDSYMAFRVMAFRVDAVIVDGDETIPASSIGTATVWPTNIFNVDDIASDMAYLVPADATNASMYADVARCAFAIPDRPHDEATDGPALQKLIHGCGLPGEARAPYTGMRHMLSNKIRLPPRDAFFDRCPCFSIIPCLPLAAVKAWNGGSYAAIVVAGSWDGIEARDIYRWIMPRRALKLASVDQVNIARDLLTDTVLALAYSFHHRRERMTDGANPATITALGLLADNYTPADPSEQGIIVPMRQQHDLPNMRVALIEYTGHDENTGHPAPDPMLLAIKAAINWSWRNNQKMMEGKPEEVEEDDLESLEEEEYLEFPLEELAAGLHQTGGWVDHGIDAD
jgi:hypothetical protein